MLKGDLLYQVKVATRTVDLGQVPGGRRLDIHFAGDILPGSRIDGSVEGVDRVLVGPDGVGCLDVRYVITTGQGDKVIVRTHGYSTPSKEPGVFSDLREATTFETGSTELAYLNQTLAVTVGESRPAEGDFEVRLDVYCV